MPSSLSVKKANTILRKLDRFLGYSEETFDSIIHAIRLVYIYGEEETDELFYILEGLHFERDEYDDYFNSIVEAVRAITLVDGKEVWEAAKKKEEMRLKEQNAKEEDEEEEAKAVAIAISLEDAKKKEQRAVQAIELEQIKALWEEKKRCFLEEEKN